MLRGTIQTSYARAAIMSVVETDCTCRARLFINGITIGGLWGGAEPYFNLQERLLRCGVWRRMERIRWIDKSE